MTPLTSPSPEERAREVLATHLVIADMDTPTWNALQAAIAAALTSAAEAARRAERERCVGIARDWAGTPALQKAMDSVGMSTLSIVRFEAKQIATAIEAGTEDGNVE